MRIRYQWTVEQTDERGQDGPASMWRAELWLNPYAGVFLAATKWRTRKSDAVKDAIIAFGRDRRWKASR